MYLITGGAGFIGSHIATALVADGHRVRIFDNLSGGKRANLAHIQDEVEIVEGDLRDAAALRVAMTGIEYVFHQAAEPSVPRSIADPATTFAINQGGTLNVLEAARDAGVRRVVFASTCAVYGDTAVTPIAETTTPNPLSPYAMSKLTGEQLCQMFTRIHGLETVALRYFNVFGVRQDPHSAYAAAIPKFLDLMLAGQRPIIFGDGGQSRDFVAVEDVARANLLAAHATNAAGMVFNVASGRETTINQVVTYLGEILDRPADPDYQPARAGDIRTSLANTDRARDLLGFVATEPFRDGLARLIDGMLTIA